MEFENHVAGIEQANDDLSSTPVRRSFHARYTPAQDQVIIDGWTKLSSREIAAQLGITVDALKGRAHRLKLPPLRPVAVDWHPEHIQFLCDNWGKISASEIAAPIGKTKSAVIGKAHRLGLPRLKLLDGKAIRIYRTRAKRQRREVRPGLPLPKAKIVRKPAVPEAPMVIDAQIPFEQRKTLLQLEKGDCRWPVGDPQTADFFFCGAPAFAGQPYCAAHCRRAHQAYQPKSWTPKVIRGGLSRAYPNQPGGAPCNSPQTAAI